MVAELDDHIVQNFIELTNLPRSNAVRWLKAHNNDPNNAVMAWFDGGMASLPPPPPPSKYDNTYSESQFHSDREGNPPQSQLEASFGLSQPGALDPGAFNENVPPTRPSSRVSNTRVSPIYGPGQLEHGHTGDQELTQSRENNPNVPREESYDEQMARATQNSLNDSRTLPNQQTGTTYNNQYFGPPTQSHYDFNQWAMTVPESSTQEILLAPEPQDREREPGFPAFLRPSLMSETVPALIKILHTIPLAREAFLNRNLLLEDYGQDGEWWDGKPTPGLRVINVDDNEYDQAYEDIIYEIQRLMAFLDDTERAYGSVEALLKQKSFTREADRTVAPFLDYWKAATQCLEGQGPQSRIFTSHGLRRDKETGHVNFSNTFSCFAVRVDAAVADHGFSLYEAIDDMMWSNADGVEAFLDEIGEIFIFDVTNHVLHSDHLGISIPPIWYADRYLESGLEHAAKIRAEKEAIFVEIDEIDQIQRSMVNFEKPEGHGKADVGPLMETVSNYFRQTAEYKDSLEDESPQSPSPPSQRIGPICEALSTLGRRVSERVDGFQDVRENISQRLQDASKGLTEPSDVPDSPPHRKYILKGVITNPTSFYVLDAVQEDDIDDALHSDSVPGQQWWRIEYDTTSLTPVRITKVTEDQVLIAASGEGSKAYLIYASEAAANLKRDPLPRQLRNFVRSDNLAFRTDLENFRPSNIPNGLPAALSPHKRKAASNSDSDMEVEADTSPQLQPQDYYGSASSSPLDPNPLGASDLDYESVDRPITPPRPRAIAPRPSTFVSSDERVPVSLQQHDSEMQERGTGMLEDLQIKPKVPKSTTDDINMGDDAGPDEADGKAPSA